MRRPLAQDFAALMVFFALTAIGTYPVSVRMASELHGGGGDSALIAYTIAWDAEALLGRGTPRPAPVPSCVPGFFNAPFFHPFPLSLAYSEHLLGIALFAGPISFLSGNPILGANIAFFLAFWLTAFGVYKLVEDMSEDFLAAILAGTAFAFCSFRYNHIPRTHLLSCQWLPFCLLYLRRYFVGRDGRAIVLAAGFFLLQCLCSWYQAVFASIAAGIMVLWEVRQLRRAALAAGAFALAGLPAAVLSRPYVVVKDLYPESIYSIASRLTSGASLLDYFFPSQNNLLYCRLLGLKVEGWLPTGEPWEEHTLLPGILTLLLCLAYVLSRSKPSRLPSSFVVIGGAGFVLSLGPVLRTFTALTPVPLPYGLLYAFFTPAQIVRWPARYAELTMLALAIAGGFGLLSLRNALGRYYVPVGIALIGIAFLEGVGIPVETVRATEWKRDEDAYRYLAALPGNEAVVILDKGYAQGDAGRMMLDVLHTLPSHRPVVNGFSGFTPDGYEKLRQLILAFPDENALRVMRKLDIRWVMFHADEFDAPVRKKLACDAARLVHKDFGRLVLYDAFKEPVTEHPATLSLSVRAPEAVPMGNDFAISVTVKCMQGGPAVFTPARDRVLAHAGASCVVGRLPLFLIPGEEALVPISVRRVHTERVRVIVELPSGYGDLREHLDIPARRDLPTSAALLPDGAKSAIISAPDRVKQGERFRVVVRLQNGGQVYWLSRPRPRFCVSPLPVQLRPGRIMRVRLPREEPVGAVQLRLIEVRDRTGAAVPFWADAPAGLPHDVSPGQTVEVEMELGGQWKAGEFEHVIGLSVVGSSHEQPIAHFRVRVQ